MFVHWIFNNNDCLNCPNIYISLICCIKTRREYYLFIKKVYVDFFFSIMWSSLPIPFLKLDIYMWERNLLMSAAVTFTNTYIFFWHKSSLYSKSPDEDEKKKKTRQKYYFILPNRIFNHSSFILSFIHNEAHIVFQKIGNLPSEFFKIKLQIRQKCFNTQHINVDTTPDIVSQRKFKISVLIMFQFVFCSSQINISENNFCFITQYMHLY